jgi:hypothetical protein
VLCFIGLRPDFYVKMPLKVGWLAAARELALQKSCENALSPRLSPDFSSQARRTTAELAFRRSPLCGKHLKYFRVSSLMAGSWRT